MTPIPRRSGGGGSMTRAQIYDDARLLSELWNRGDHGRVLRFVRDRTQGVGEIEGLMTLAALLHVHPGLLNRMVDELQAHLKPEME